MKQAILTNWTFFRVVRLLIGIIIIIQAISTKDISIGFVGILFTLMPMFNIGCCGTGGCSIKPIKNTDTPKNITFEEIV
jgi:hypothetical protein